MYQQHHSIWIFVFLVLTILLTALYPHPGMIFFGAIASSLLVFFQVFLILNSREQSPKTADEEWYEHQ